MAIFKRKKEDEYLSAQNEINNGALKAKDLIIFEALSNDDERVTYLVKKMKEGNPLVVNFENLEVSHANKMLAFLAGATFAIEGRTIEISEKIYLFARSVDFLDGTLENFLENI